MIATDSDDLFRRLASSPWCAPRTALPNWTPVRYPLYLTSTRLLQGNAPGKDRAMADAEDAGPPAQQPSPQFSPGSPLTYSPQVAMEPLSKPEEGAHRSAEFHGVAGWPAQPKLVPVVIVCKCCRAHHHHHHLPLLAPIIYDASQLSTPAHHSTPTPPLLALALTAPVTQAGTLGLELALNTLWISFVS